MLRYIAVDFIIHKKFNTNLELNKNLFEIHNGGMANGSARALRLTTRTKEQVDFVAYNMVAGVKDLHADKGITYRYDAISNKTLMLANDAEPTPGVVTAEESPMHAEVRIPDEEPTINNQTVAEFQNDGGVTFSVQASSGMGFVKRVVLQVKDNTMEEYENYNLLKNGDSDVFRKSMEAVDLYGKKYFDYRFIVSGGFHTVVTEEKRITSTSSQEDTLRFEMEKNQYKSEDNQYLSGETSIITTGDQFLLDEKDITAETVSSIAGNAKILIDVSQTDTFFKNAIAIGDNVIGIFNEGTYENWATVGYDVDASYFVKGDSLTIDIHAGNKANPLEHNEENNDDFVVKNIRLVLPDGRTLRAKGYENPETIINMGDSAGKIEILHAKFTAPDAAYQAIRYDVDTNTLADGEHVFTAKDGGEERRLTVHVDNTPAEIISNITDGEVCKGTYTIEPSFVEEGSGVSSVTAKLDGKKIELPYEFRSLEMTAGEQQEKIETLNGFPYQQFEIQVGETVTENDQIQVKWKGNSNSEKTKLYVYSVVTGKWDLAETKSTEEDGEKSLTALISLKDHIENGKVKVMVQSGEGYTPVQYEEGAAALPSDNPNVKVANEKDTPRNQYDFTFAVESDTQYYNEDYVGNPQKDVDGKYQYQLDIHDWIIANQPRMNIQYLFHDGDIIDDAPLIPGWENADNAYKKLDDAGIPYGILAGNHDVGHLSGDYTNYCKYFGASRYENRPWYGGNNKDNRQHYDLITVGGIDFIMLYTGWGIEDEEIDWMNEVLSQYPERKAILNFHEYLLASGGLGEEPQWVYDEVVSKNPNVCMVLSGHYHNAQTVVSQFDDDGDSIAERNVYQMLFDYQGLAEGGMGYMRLMHFDLEGQRIIVRTYSPSLDDYDAKDNSNLGGEAIVGEEDFEIPFADLGIVSKEKVLSTTDFDVNVYTDQVIGEVKNVESGSKAEYTWTDAQNGVYGWYAEIKDDFGGNVCTDVRYFSLNRDIVAPVITLPEKNEIVQDAEFTIMDGVTAMDDREGDLTSAIKTSGNIDIHTPGLYTIVYTVSDSSGNEAQTTRNITVLEKREGTENKDITAPVLTVPGDAVIKVGEAFDVRKDVSALDDVDGDLTDKIQISGKFDIRTPGTYVIVYRVSDNAGNTATAERKITVEYNNVVKTGDSTFLGWFGIGLVTLGTMVKIKRKRMKDFK
ncbi:immunoglobulin-like domain-containing protein [Roseburia sp. MSJ-14]|uniref:immunoglobulin-like domain-containing protein n=1 Tax=Roseburia sp. MSJ-14 TaxID=2841514 RepID=UPI001C11459B|nr:immunoglobulin-like domain-containing protein [Roseburia sp. MSJ-14]